MELMARTLRKSISEEVSNRISKEICKTQMVVVPGSPKRRSLGRCKCWVRKEQKQIV
jgi:hypothetical protein